LKAKHLYLVLAVVGLVVPYCFFISFLLDHDPNRAPVFRQLAGTDISAFFAADLLLSSVVFVRYLRQEAARVGIRHWWLYLIALCTVGLSFALPLFLYVREGRLEGATGRRG
jgi:hypothetical protein